MINALIHGNFQTILRYFLFNLAFVSVQMGILFIYLSIKNRTLTNIFKGYLGLGDLLFLVMICIALSPINFILFYIDPLFDDPYCQDTTYGLSSKLYYK